MIQRVNVQLNPDLSVIQRSPSDADAFWYMPRDRAEGRAHPITIPQDATWIGLDPGITSPHVRVAVDVPGLGPSLLSAGAVLPIPAKCRPLAAWNVYTAIAEAATYMHFPDAPLSFYGEAYGRVSLVCGDASSLGAWLSYANRQLSASPRTLPLVCAAVPNGQYVAFPTFGVTKIRVSAHPADAAGNPLVAVPADFSVTLRRFWDPLRGRGRALVYGDALDTGPVVDIAGTSVETGAGTTLVDDAIAGAGVTVQYAEWATMSAWREGLVVTALAGADVGTVFLTVEGA